MRSAVSIRETLRQRAFELMGDPRVVKLMQNPAVAGGLVSVVKGVGRVRGVVLDQQRRVAKTLGFAPQQELEELQRRLARVEDEARRLARRVDEDENP
jgi:hypothetical protein